MTALPSPEAFLTQSTAGLQPVRLQPITPVRLVTHSGWAEQTGTPIEWKFTQRDGETDSTANLTIGGYFGRQAFYGASREAGALTRGTATFEPPREADDLDFGTMLRPEESLALATLAVMRSIHESHGIDSFHVVGHSLGGGAAVALARLLVEDRVGGKRMNVRSVTAADSVGSTGHGTIELATRAPFAVARAFQNRHRFVFASEETTRSILGAYEYVRPCPVRTALGGLACTRTDIRQWVRTVRSSGIPVGALAHEDDEFFPVRRARKHIGAAVTAFLDGSPSRGVGHFAPQIEPARFMLDHERLLERML